MTTNSFMLDLLKKWRAGKKLTKSQYTELVNDGLLIELEPDVYELSKHGFEFDEQAIVRELCILAFGELLPGAPTFK